MRTSIKLMGLLFQNSFFCPWRIPIGSTLILAACFSFIGCSSKAFTRPRSEVISEAVRQGIEVTSIEEERAQFFEQDEIQRQKLMALISARAEGPAHDSSYRIGPADEIEINVFDVPELNITARVRQSGFVSLPLIGAMKATGLTETEFHDELVKRLSSYVRRPQASVFISNYGSQKVAVLGAVAKPGTYPLKKGANSVLELLSEAGGVNDKAGNLLSFIPAELSGISASNDVEARAKLALASNDILSGTSHQASRLSGGGVQIYLDQVLGTAGGIPLEIPVRGGDMIIVPEAGKIMVEGEVQKVGQFDLGQQMTLLSALAAAGGITYGAKVDEVEVVRESGLEKKTRLVVDLTRIANGEEKDVRLRNGDLIRVPSHSGRRMSQDVYDGITRILNFGIGGNVNLVP